MWHLFAFLCSITHYFYITHNLYVDIIFHFVLFFKFILLHWQYSYVQFHQTVNKQRKQLKNLYSWQYNLTFLNCAVYLACQWQLWSNG